MVALIERILGGGTIRCATCKRAWARAAEIVEYCPSCAEWQCPSCHALRDQRAEPPPPAQMRDLRVIVSASASRSSGSLLARLAAS